jgi:hypothetical protein
LVSSLAAINVQAESYTTIDLPVLNTNLITPWTDGIAYSGLFTGTQILGGIPFALSTDKNGNNAFFPAGNPFNKSGNIALTIQTNIVNPTTVYTLINTAYGNYGSNVGSISFYGSNNLNYTLQLVEGLNVRDHYYGGFVNSTSSPFTQNVYNVNSLGNAHLDMQTIQLPSFFQQETLTSIVFQSNELRSNGEPFLAGVTVGILPGP